MAERKWTPGPWEINPAEPTQIMTSEKPHELICRTPPEVYANRAKANAHLIAAAPDMLEALQGVRDDISIIVAAHKLGKDRTVNRAMQRIRAALSRARGDTP